MSGILKYPEYELLGLKHRSIVESRLKKMQPQASELNFTEIFAWRPTRNTKVCLIDGILCLDFEKDGTHYLAYLCEGCEISQAAGRMLEDYRKNGFNAMVACLTKKAASHFMEQERFIVSSNRDMHDFVYRTGDLIRLEGRKYDGKRNQVRQFARNYSHELVALNNSNKALAMEIQAEWCRARKCEPGTVLADEGVAIEQMLTHFGDLDIFGAVLMADGKPAAYTLAGTLNDSTAVVYVEKALHGYKGAYQAINQMFAEKFLGKYGFINREQDMGDDGLRHAKMSYHPDHMVEKYNVRLK